MLARSIENFWMYRAARAAILLLRRKYALRSSCLALEIVEIERT